MSAESADNPKSNQAIPDSPPTDEAITDECPEEGEEDASESVEKHAIWAKYFSSEHGHEAVMKALGIIESVKALTGQTTLAHARWEKIQQSAIIGLVIVAGSVLAYLGKLDSTAGVLLGTCVGYAFGRKQ